MFHFLLPSNFLKEKGGMRSHLLRIDGLSISLIRIFEIKLGHALPLHEQLQLTER